MHPFRTKLHTQNIAAIRKMLVMAVAAFAALLTGCQTDAPEKPDRSLSELVHRYVMSSPLLDECIEEWGLGPKKRFKMFIEIHPSGELVPLEAKDGNAELNKCLMETIPRLRLPKDSVTEVKSTSISIR